MTSNQSKGTFERHIPCPSCGSRDNLAVYRQPDSTVDASCWSCKYYTKDPYGHYNDTNSDESQAQSQPQRLARDLNSGTSGSTLTINECLSHPIRSIPERSLSQSTCERFKVRIGVNTKDGITPIYYLFPRTKDSELSGFVQKQVPNKKFTAIGDCKDCDPFGYDLLPEKGNKLFVAEGPEDAMSIYQALKENAQVSWEPNCIGLMGVNGIKRLNELHEHISRFNEIIFCLDSDAAGREAAEKLCKMFSGKSYTVKLPLKDANEMLMAGRTNDLKWAVLTSAKKYQPDGIINAKDCWDRYSEIKEVEYYKYPSSMQGLNERMYGVKPATLITLTSGTGAGKTQLVRELQYHFLRNTKEKQAIVALEEDVGDSVSGLISLHLNKRVLDPNVTVSPEEEKQAFNDLFSDGRVTLYDYFGGMDDDNLFSKLRYFASTGHQFIFLDHLSIVVSEYASDGDERKRIDVIMTKLAKFVKETGVNIFMIVHLKNPPNTAKPFEMGAVPTINDLRGSGAIKQLSWDVIGLSRNQQHPNPRCRNTSMLHVLKCRNSGKTGPAGYLYFDEKTGRMISTEEPAGYASP